MMSHPIAPILLAKSRSATEPTTYLAGDYLRKGQKPYFEPKGVFDYDAAAKKMGAPLSHHGVPQFPKQNKTFAGGAVPAPVHGKNICSPYVQSLNNQSKQDFENLLAIQAPFNNEAKMLLQREFAAKNEMSDLLEIESLLLQGLTEEEIAKFQRDKYVKRVLENPMKHKVNNYLDRQNLLRDFARSRGYELPDTVATAAGVTPTEIRFTGKTELSIKRLAALFLSQKEELAKKEAGNRMWGSQHNPSPYFPINAPASADRSNVLPDVNGTNDRGGLSYGNVAESEIMMGRTARFGGRPGGLAGEVDRITEQPLGDRLDALRVPHGGAGSATHHRVAVQQQTGSMPGGGAAATRHGKPKIPMTLDEFNAGLSKKTTSESKRDYMNKVIKDVLPEARQRELSGSSRAEKLDAIAEALSK